MKRYAYIFVTLMLVLTACNHKELCYHHPHTARVRINVDWSEFDREEPTGMTTMVFPAEGGTPHTSLGHTLDHATFDLLEGNYHTMTFNQSPSEFGSVTFRNMDNFQEAEVLANHITSRWYKGRTEGEVIATDPEWLASDSDMDNRVTEDMVNKTRHELEMDDRQYPLTEHLLTTHTPQNMVYTVHVKVRVRGIHNLRSARAALDGFAEGMKLATHQPLAGKVTHLMESWKMKQDASDPTQGYITATFQCFGFPFGHQALPEENNFRLSLLLVDNKTQLNRVFHVGDLFVEDAEDDHILYLELDWGDGLPDDNPDDPDDPDNPDNPDNPDDPDDPDNPDNPDNPDDPDDPGKLPDVKPEGGSSSGFDATVEDWGEEIEHDIKL